MTYLLKEKQNITEQAQKLAVFDGWTEETLEKAVKKSGYDRGVMLQAFPGGVEELIDFSVTEADRRMLEALEKQDVASMRIRDRIAMAVRIRLEQNLEHGEAIRRTLAHYALPQNAARGAARLMETVSRMWYAAGDNATDFNWYTKRALLAGVYMSTLLFWLNDESEGQQETWEFLDRRIDDVMQIQKAKGKAQRVAEDILRPFV